MTQKIKVSQQQRDNLLDALNNMWPSVPEANVVRGLRAWRDNLSIKTGEQPPNCNTLCCFGGWCAWWPNFQAQGISSRLDGSPRVTGELWSSSSGVSEKLFGHPSLFDERGRGSIDYALGCTGGYTDHQWVAKRLRWLLDNSEVK